MPSVPKGTKSDERPGYSERDFHTDSLIGSLLFHHVSFVFSKTKIKDRLLEQAYQLSCILGSLYNLRRKLFFLSFLRSNVTLYHLPLFRRVKFIIKEFVFPNPIVYHPTKRSCREIR